MDQVKKLSESRKMLHFLISSKSKENLLNPIIQLAADCFGITLRNKDLEVSGAVVKVHVIPSNDAKTVPAEEIKDKPGCQIQ